MKLRYVALCSLSLLFLAMGPQARAQYVIGWIGSTTWLGVQGGANFASESFSSLPDNSSNSLRTGLIGGATIEHWFGNNLALGASFLYDQKGTNEQYADAAANRQVGNKLYSGTDAFTLTYFEIPVKIIYAMGTGLVRPYICAGPSFGLLLSASETSGGSLAPLSTIKSYTKSSDASIYVALGALDHILNGPIFFFEGGYAVGMTNVFQSTSARTATDGNEFKEPIDLTAAKSGDIRVTVGAMWEL